MNNKKVNAVHSVVENLVYVEGRAENIVTLLLNVLQTVWERIANGERRFDTVSFNNWMFGKVNVVIRETAFEAAKVDVFWYKEDGSIRTHLEATVTPDTGVTFDRRVSKGNFRATTEIAILEALIESVQISNPTEIECERHPELDRKSVSAERTGDRAIKLPSIKRKSKKKYHGKKVTDMRPYDKWTWCMPGYWRRTGYSDGTSYEYDAISALKTLVSSH